MRRPTVIVLAATVAIVLASVPCQAQLSAHRRGAKSEGIAVGASLLGTVVPTVVGIQAGGGPFLFYGIFLGPSTGYFYAGNAGRGFGGAVLRFGIATAAALGAVAACGSNWIWSCDDPGLSNTIALTGLGLMAVSAIYDIAGAGNAARHWNEAHAAGPVSIMPRVDVDRRAAGLNVRIAF